MKNVTIIGCGAVGALYGLRLHSLLGEKGLTFLVDETRKERYERSRLTINGEKAPFRFITPGEAKKSDLVIVATKNHHLSEVIDLMDPVVGEHTTILSLLNGIESEEALSEAFGSEHLIYGFAIGLNSTNIDNAVTYTAEGRIVFGEKDNSESDRILAIKALFDRAGIASVIAPDILVALYNKFMLNTVYNTISGVLGATYEELKSDAVWRLAQAVAEEVRAVSALEGVDLPLELVAENHQIVTALGAGKTSMAQDMEAGRVTENAWFCGTVVRLGEKHSLPTPVCATLSDLVEAYEAKSDPTR
jgi:2-dehydropantoate 2-reductase